MRQYRTSLTASRFVADPGAPELKPRFEFRLGGPAPAEYSPPMPGGSHPDYPEWSDYRYPRSDRQWVEDEWGEDEQPVEFVDEEYPAAPDFWATQQTHAYPNEHEDDDELTPLQSVLDRARAAGKRVGAHRLPPPPAALKGRAAVLAVAAGAAVAAGQAAFADSGTEAAPTASGLDAAASNAAASGQATGTVKDSSFTGPQVLDIASPMQQDVTKVLATGKEFAKDRAAREAMLMRPQFVKFTNGTFTSGFGFRWGAMHAGVDIAAPIGTPIYAVADGTVIDAGPASGFGMWVRLRHSDGTVTVYGHVNTTTVTVGQHVTAGDKIATVGNRGFSTGPHCHFEVWRNGSDKIDPLPWLNSRGISLGAERD